MLPALAGLAILYSLFAEHVLAALRWPVSIWGSELPISAFVAGRACSGGEGGGAGGSVRVITFCGFTGVICIRFEQKVHEEYLKLGGVFLLVSPQHCITFWDLIEVTKTTLYLPIPACSVMWTATRHPRTPGQRAPPAKLLDPHRTSPSSSPRGRRDRYEVCLGPTILHYSSPSTSATPSPPASLSSLHDLHRSSSRAGLASTVLRSALIALMKLENAFN